MGQIDREGKGVKVDGHYVSNLRSAGGVVLVASELNELVLYGEFHRGI